MYLLYHRTTAPTGRVLGEALGIPHGSNPPRDRQDMLIRWGSQAAVALRPLQTINQRNALARASSKFDSLGIMRAAGVSVPNHARSPHAVNAPFLGRADNHTRGTDIVLCMQRSDAARTPSDYYIEYVPVASEYRVHIFNRTVIKVSQKVLTNPDQYQPWCRNYETGHTFRRPRIQLGQLQETMAADAVFAHGLHFGAVDLIIGDDGNTYVLEVNGAPSLSPSSARDYVIAFRDMLNAQGLEAALNLDALEQAVAEEDEVD